MTKAARTQPSIFVSHGSPMVAIERGPYQEALAAFGAGQTPKAIAVISAHWDSGRAIRVTSAERNTLVYDFGGFPRALYEVKYDAPGSPELAGRIASRLKPREVTLDAQRGLDHGAWVPLRLMFPKAEVPVVEVSIPANLAPRELYEIGRALAPLRDEGVLLMGSGGIVHNLRTVDLSQKHGEPEAWAKEFDQWFADALRRRDLEGLFGYEDERTAKLAVPTPEHFAPVFVVLGAGAQAMRVSDVYEGFEHGTLSMRCFAME